MKKMMTKPVLAVAAAATIIAGVTPLLADASSVGTPSAIKVVMNDEGKQVTRYNLKELAANDPTTLNMLLKSQADHLYIVVDKINLDEKLQTYMEEHKEEWERVYQQYYSDIWLEVRFDDAAAHQEIVSVSAKTEDGKVYIKGIVTSEVTKVKVTKPNGDIIEVVPTSEDSFTVSFASVGSGIQEVTVEAYVGMKAVDSEKVKVIAQAEEDADLLLHTLSILDAKKEELKVNGIVKLDADKVYVTYGKVRKAADVKKLWDGVGSFSVTLKDVQAGSGKALVEVFEDGKKVDSESIDVKVVNQPSTGDKVHYALKGTAVINAKNKTVHVKGKVDGWAKNDKAKLLVTAPDGKKQEVKPNDKGEFEWTLSYNNRSYSAKTLHFEIYLDDKLVAQGNIPYGTPVNHIVKPILVPVDHDEDDDDKDDDDKKGKDKHKHPNGNAYGYWKKHQDHHDDDDYRDDDK